MDLKSRIFGGEDNDKKTPSQTKSNKDVNMIMQEIKEKKQKKHVNLYQFEEQKQIDKYFIKQEFKKLITNLNNNELSFWYDNLEQEKKDFKDMNEVYQKVQRNIKEAYDAGKEKTKQEHHSSEPQQNQHSQHQQKQIFDYFVKQKSNFDTWGRKLLLKPNRKYKQSRFWQIQSYYIYDFFKQLFAISFLEEKDFKDYKGMLSSQSSFLEEYDLSPNTNKSYLQQIDSNSISFKKIKQYLLQKIQQSGFLFDLFTKTDSLILENESKFKLKELNIDQSQIIFKSDCQFITIEGAYYGHFILTNDFVIYQSANERLENRNEDKYKFSLQEKLDQRIKKIFKIIHINDIEELMKRRFLLIHSAFEIFTFEKKSLFFHLFTSDICNQFLSKLEEVKKNNKYNVKIVSNLREEFKRQRILKLWENNEIQTQQFLLLVNKYSGRSYNDLRQYPIFPWILTEYKLNYKQLQEKLQKEEGFRNLSKHSGVLSKFKEEEAVKNFEEERDDILYGPFHFHLKFGYSNILSCLRLLNRMEPFTQIFLICNGNLDDANRTFKSIHGQWKNVLDEKQNNDELTPEFFFFPEIFKNHNLNHFGVGYHGKSVNEVKMPKWSTSPHDFIRIHRECLESLYVKNHLKSWIDMIFGTRQDDDKKKNKLFCYAYEKNLVLPEIKDNINTASIRCIAEFMQVPYQLFTQQLQKQNKKNKLNVSSNIQQDNVQEEEKKLSNEREGKSNTPATKLQEQNQINFAKSQELQLAQLAEQNYQLSIIETFLDSQQLKKVLKYKSILSQSSVREKNISHIIFFERRCLVLEKEIIKKDFICSNYIKIYATETTNYFKDEQKGKNDCKINSDILKGNFNNNFQIYTESLNKSYLFVAQNLDQTIKVYDINKKGVIQLFHSENINNNIVRSIKLSKNNNYLISGDDDGVICVYVLKNPKEKKQQKFKNINLTPSAPLKPKDQSFPFRLYHQFQGHYDQILGIDINLTLDMFATCSRDGKIHIYCLRSSRLWKVIKCHSIQIEKKNKQYKIISFNLTLHGYIILILEQEDFLTQIYVYSLNGELLYEQLERVQIRNVSLVQNEQNLLFSQNIRLKENRIISTIKVVKLYTMEKVLNLEKFFQQLPNFNIQQTNKNEFPLIKCMSISEDESKLNLILESGELFCFDTQQDQLQQNFQYQFLF